MKQRKRRGTNVNEEEIVVQHKRRSLRNKTAPVEKDAKVDDPQNTKCNVDKEMTNKKRRGRKTNEDIDLKSCTLINNKKKDVKISEKRCSNSKDVNKDQRDSFINTNSQKQSDNEDFESEPEVKRRKSNVKRKDTKKKMPKGEGSKVSQMIIGKTTTDQTVERDKKMGEIDIKNESGSSTLLSFKSEDLTKSIKPKKQSKESTPKKQSIHDNDIRDMLLKFESQDKNTMESAKPGADLIEEFENDSDDNTESDWEEVADVSTTESQLQKQLPDKPVEITVHGPDLMRKKKKKKFDIQEWYRLQMNKFKRYTQGGVHKVHLLCLIAHGMWRNKVCELSLLHGYALSYIPPQFLETSAKWSVTGLSTFTHWFINKFRVDESVGNQSQDFTEMIKQSFEKCNVNCVSDLVYLYLISLRVLGLEVRLVMSLQPVSYKAKDLKSKSGEIIRDKEEPSTSRKAQRPSSNKAKSTEKLKKKVIGEKLENKESSGNGKKEANTENVSPYFSDNCSTQNKNSESQTGKNSGHKSQNKRASKTKSSKVSSKQVEGCSDSLKVSKKTLSRRKSASKVQTYKEQSEESCEDKYDDNGDKKRRKKPNDKERSKQVLKKDVGTIDKENAKQQDDSSLSSNDEFEPHEKTYRSPKGCTSSKQRGKKPVKILSSDSEDSVCITDKDINTWVEIFLETEDNWITVDCIKNSVNKPKEIENVATQPVKYILAFYQGEFVKHVKNVIVTSSQFNFLASEFLQDVKDVILPSGFIKDVTKKYVKNWMTHTRKLRIAEEWWEETLENFIPPVSDKTKKEDLLVQARLMEQPMPTSVGELKNHPLYVLKRHLLKFDAIYPPDAPPLGFIRGEPVYARECVHTLHSRENWLKEARLVRIGEEAYKWVKARPKRNKPTENKNELTLPIFGYWQTEDYIPPPAVDGKVPRNEYGNVELFKPSMLPGGTVHLQGLPGLNRIARKLGLDCVAAMTGWDHHSGYAHPILDGWVVCEEHKDILIAAWDEQQEIDRQREAEKREKRVLDNWKKLIKGLLIKQKLQKKYNMTVESHDKSEKACQSSKSQSASNSGETLGKVVNTAMAWPVNRQEEQKKKCQDEPKSRKKKRQEKEPLFPFEMETM